MQTQSGQCCGLTSARPSCQTDSSDRVLAPLLLLALLGLSNHFVLHNRTFFANRKIVSEKGVLIIDVNVTFCSLHHDFPRHFKSTLFLRQVLLLGELIGRTSLISEGSSNLLGDLFLLALLSLNFMFFQIRVFLSLFLNHHLHFLNLLFSSKPILVEVPALWE